MEAKDFMPADDTVAGIRKDLAAYETEREAAYRTLQRRIPIGFISLIVAVFVLAWFFNTFADPFEQWVSTPHVFLYVGAFVAAFFVYFWAQRPAAKVQQSFREKLLPIIFSFVQDMSYRQGATPDSFDRMPREMVGAFNRQTFDDVITGRYDGFPFELYEASLRQKVNKSDNQVFKGVIVVFETMKPFPGVLVASRKAGQVTKFFRGLFGGVELQELQSGVAALDAAYDFRTDNLNAARPLVTGRLAQALQWLKETWPDDHSRVALNGSDGFLLLPLTKNFFELPGISKPLDYKAHIEPMVADLAALLATASLVRKAGVADDEPAQQP